MSPDVGKRRIEVGLVLQGGGAPGAYEWGPLSALLELMEKAQEGGHDVVLRGVTGVLRKRAARPSCRARPQMLLTVSGAFSRAQSSPLEIRVFRFQLCARTYRDPIRKRRTDTPADQ